MAEHNTIELTFKPIWMQQPEETVEQYKAFVFWASSDKPPMAVKVCIDRDLQRLTPVRNRWQERGEAYWQDVQSRLQVGLNSALSRLNAAAIEAAYDLIRLDRDEEYTAETVKDTDPDTKRTTINTKSRKRIGPSERVVTQLINHMHEAARDTGNVDLAEILKAMVQDTVEGSEPPADSGLEGE